MSKTKGTWIRSYEISDEDYERIQAETKKFTDDFNKKYPALKNLVWADNEMYYTDDDGNRLSDIDTKRHLEEIQKQILESFAEIAPKDPIKVTKFDSDTGEVTSVEEKDRVSMLQEELDKTKFTRNNARAFIEGIEEGGELE